MCLEDGRAPDGQVVPEHVFDVEHLDENHHHRRQRFGDEQTDEAEQQT